MSLWLRPTSQNFTYLCKYHKDQKIQPSVGKYTTLDFHKGTLESKLLIVLHRHT